ncbi:MAG TPA: N-acetyltransferase [Pseudomonadota bacterium]|nr:N-acetyltransferase [Pseudomonadota bacterium]
MKRRLPSALVVRVATEHDAPLLTDFAHALADGPLLSRYGADPAKLATEFCSLAASARPSETLLVAVHETEAGIRPATALYGIARVAHSGMFGSFGGYLKLIAVGAAAQGMGVGSLLLSHAEQTVASHSRDMFLLTSDFNDDAQRFYDRHGYREVGRLPGYVRPEITEVIFWKRLRTGH